jgi:hypothetical protein
LYLFDKVAGCDFWVDTNRDGLFNICQATTGTAANNNPMMLFSEMCKTMINQAKAHKAASGGLLESALCRF